MKTFIHCSILFLFTAALNIHSTAQSLIDSLIVETYYVADESDIAYSNIDDDIYQLPEGAITYRVYLDLAEGVQLKSFFAEEGFEFYIGAEGDFWNHGDRGETWGFDFRDNRLDENTAALDSWLTFGGATEDHWGVLKEEDTDGSVFATDENPLLSNSGYGGRDLNESDGLIPSDLETVPLNFNDPLGVFDATFGEEIHAPEFRSTNFRVQTAGLSYGLSGNKILIGQFTTVGELELNLNVELINADGEIVQYVGTETNGNEKVYSPYLKYPVACGCLDPDYLEYDPTALCTEQGACQEMIVFGCNDEEACNYDPAVNFNVEGLCCYGIGNCNGLDISILCPEALSVDENGNTELSLKLFPNPAGEHINLELDSTLPMEEGFIQVRDINGRLVKEFYIAPGSSYQFLTIDLSDLYRGVYIMTLSMGEVKNTQKFVKL